MLTVLSAHRVLVGSLSRRQSALVVLSTVVGAQRRMNPVIYGENPQPSLAPPPGFSQRRNDVTPPNSQCSHGNESTNNKATSSSSQTVLKTNIRDNSYHSNSSISSARQTLNTSSTLSFSGDINLNVNNNNRNKGSFEAREVKTTGEGADLNEASQPDIPAAPQTSTPEPNSTTVTTACAATNTSVLASPPHIRTTRLNIEAQPFTARTTASVVAPPDQLPLAIAPIHPTVTTSAGYLHPSVYITDIHAPQQAYLQDSCQLTLAALGLVGAQAATPDSYTSGRINQGAYISNLPHVNQTNTLIGGTIHNPDQLLTASLPQADTLQAAQYSAVEPEPVQPQAYFAAPLNYGNYNYYQGLDVVYQPVSSAPPLPNLSTLPSHRPVKQRTQHPRYRGRVHTVAPRSSYRTRSLTLNSDDQGHGYNTRSRSRRGSQSNNYSEQGARPKTSFERGGGRGNTRPSRAGYHRRQRTNSYRYPPERTNSSQDHRASAESSFPQRQTVRTSNQETKESRSDTVANIQAVESDRSGNQASERSDNQASEKSGNQASDRSDNQASERSDNQASERSDNQASERSDNQASERSDNQASERSDNQASERSDNQASESQATAAGVKTVETRKTYSQAVSGDQTSASEINNNHSSEKRTATDTAVTAKPAAESNTDWNSRSAREDAVQDSRRKSSPQHNGTEAEVPEEEASRPYSRESSSSHQIGREADLPEASASTTYRRGSSYEQFRREAELPEEEAASRPNRRGSSSSQQFGRETDLPEASRHYRRESSYQQFGTGEESRPYRRGSASYQQFGREEITGEESRLYRRGSSSSQHRGHQRRDRPQSFSWERRGIFRDDEPVPEPDLIPGPRRSRGRITQRTGRGSFDLILHHTPPPKRSQPGGQYQPARSLTGSPVVEAKRARKSRNKGRNYQDPQDEMYGHQRRVGMDRYGPNQSYPYGQGRNFRFSASPRQRHMQDDYEYYDNSDNQGPPRRRNRYSSSDEGSYNHQNQAPRGWNPMAPPFHPNPPMLQQWAGDYNSGTLLTSQQMSMIDSEILAYYQEHKQPEHLFKAKEELYTAVKEIVQATLPNCGLYMVGSSVNGFGSTKSDMDLCLMVSHKEIDQKTEATVILKTLHNSFRLIDFLVDISVIKAKVPILRFRDQKSNVECDLNVNNGAGIRNTHLLKEYSKCDWRLSPLVLYVKHWASFHNINDAKNCTLSSYSLTLMVIHFLQVGVRPPVLPALQTTYADVFSPNLDLRDIRCQSSVPQYHSQNTMTVGQLFTEFLYYYAHHFAFHLDAISVRTGLALPRAMVSRGNSVVNPPSQWKYICIEEPFNLSNTSRSVYVKNIFHHIRKVFEKSHKILASQGSLQDLMRTPIS